MGNIGMLSGLGQEFMNMPGQNKVRQAMWSVRKMFGFFLNLFLSVNLLSV